MTLPGSFFDLRRSPFEFRVVVFPWMQFYRLASVMRMGITLCFAFSHSGALFLNGYVFYPGMWAVPTVIKLLVAPFIRSNYTRYIDTFRRIAWLVKW